MSVPAHAPDFALRRAPLSRLLSRLLRRFVQWRLRGVERHIANQLGLTGGRLTDEIERRMTERLVSGGGFRG